MPGFGPFLGASLLVGANDLRAFPSAGHLAAAAGLVPVPNDSGRRTGNLHRPLRYSRPLRHVFYLSAQTSMMRAGPNRDYYLKKRAHGATHSQAVIALARRRIDVLWALLRENRTWTAAPHTTDSGGLTTPLRFPVPGYGPVGDLGGALTDLHHVADAGAAGAVLVLRLTHRPPAAQAVPPAPGATLLGLARKSTGRSLRGTPTSPGRRGNRRRSRAAILRGAVPLPQPSLHLLVQRVITGQLALFGALRPTRGGIMSGHRVVLHGRSLTALTRPERLLASIPRLAPIEVVVTHVDVEFVLDRRGCPPQAFGNRADGLVAAHTDLDLDTFLKAQPRTGSVGRGFAHTRLHSTERRGTTHAHDDPTRRAPYQLRPDSDRIGPTPKTP